MTPQRVKFWVFLLLSLFMRSGISAENGEATESQVRQDLKIQISKELFEFSTSSYSELEKTNAIRRMLYLSMSNELYEFQPSMNAPDAQIKALRESLLIPFSGMSSSKTYAGASLLSPGGFGLSWKDISLGITYQGRLSTSKDPDGGLSAGIGFGKAEIVGFELNVYSSMLVRRSSHGFLSGKVHHSFNSGYAVSAGYQNFFQWGLTDAIRSFYFAASKYFQLRGQLGDPFSMVTFNVGFGNGTFQFEEDQTLNKNNLNVFGSAAILLWRPVSFILDWAGPDLGAGVSVAPFSKIPLTATIGFMDITHTAGNGPRYFASLGLGFSMDSLFSSSYTNP